MKMHNAWNITDKADSISLMKWMLFVFVCLLPISALRDFTPANELRYISIADEAIRNGHWFMLTNNGEPYSDKPPFYFWLLMISKMITGEYHILMLMMFSIIPALGCIYTMDKWCDKELGRNYRNMAPLLLLTTGYFAGTAMVLRMDMLMVWFIILALREFYRMYTGEGSFKRHQILFGIYILLGFYSKAFMGILIPLVTSLVFLVTKKEGKTFFRYWNWRVWSTIIGGVALWFGMAWVEAGSEYLYSLTVGQTVSRSVNVSVHKRPFYFYILYLSYGIAPWTFLYVGNIICGFVGKKNRIFKSDLQRLFVIEVLSTFVMLSCFGSKLAIYLVPIFPFMTYLSLMCMEKMQWNKWQAFAASFPGFVILLALPAYMVATRFVPDIASPLVMICSILLTVAGGVSIVAAWRKKNIRMTIVTFCCGFLMTAFVAGFAMPEFNPQIGYGELCRKALEKEREWNLSGVTTFGVWRAQNMDVYFPERLTVYSRHEADSLKNVGNSLLILDGRYSEEEDIKSYIGDKEQVEILDGKYVLVRMP